MAILNRYVNASAVGGGDGLANGTAWTLTEAFANATPGTIVWVKKGSYSVVATLAPTNAGTVGSPIIFRGYNVTPGDLTGARLSNGELDVSNYPMINVASSIHININTSYTNLEYLNIIGYYTASSPVVVSTGTSAYLDSTRFENSAVSNAYGLTLTSNINVHNCDIVCSSTGTNSLCLSMSASKLDNCFLKLMGSAINTGYISGIGSGASIAGCVFYPNPNAKVFTFTASNSVTITANTIIGCNDVFTTANSAQTGQAFICENIICNCNRVINNQYAATGPHNLMLRDNRIRNIANADILGASDILPYNSITTDLGTGDTQDFLDYTNRNFRLVYSSPARFKSSNGNDLGALCAKVNPVAISDVRQGIDNGVGQLGTLIASSGAPVTLPASQDTRLGVVYGANNSMVGLLTKENWDAPEPVFDEYPETIYLSSSIGNVLVLGVE